MLDQVDDNALDRYVEERRKLQRKEEVAEMSFIEHIEELRWHLVRSFAAIFILGIVAFLSKKIVFGMIILGPSRTDFITFQWFCELSAWLDSDALCITEMPFTLQSRKMTGQFTMHLASSAVVGLIVAFPYVFWEIWRFLKPALYDNEKNVARGTTFIVSTLFFIGVAFGYLIVTPLSVNFLANYTVDPEVINEFDITSYVSTVTTLTLSCGLMFQLPVVIFFLAKVGLVTPASMKQYRKHALVVVLFLSAIITPPDVISQILIALPLMGLYELGIYVSAYVVRKSKIEAYGS